MALPSDPAELHRNVAATFTDRVLGVADWAAPTPVVGWTARDVVGHLLDWLPGLLASGGGPSLPDGPAVRDDPVAAWQAQVDGVQGLLDDPGTAAAPFVHPHLPEQPLATTLTNIYTSDVFMHTWDLSRATGQDEHLDADYCEQLLAGMQQMEEVLRSSGQYGPAVPVPPGADVQTRLIGFIGRDPDWRPA